MNSKSFLDSVDKNALSAIALKHGIRFIVLHGSQADSTAHDESDVDIALYFEPTVKLPLSMHAYSEILYDLSESGAIKTGNRIDISILNSANILLRFEVTQKSILLFGDPNEFEQYRAFAYRDYIDGENLFNLEHDLILKRQHLIANQLGIHQQ